MRTLPRDCEPVILSVTPWHQLPIHLQHRYCGQSCMGRIYALDIADRVVHLWAEGSLFEEAAWRHSRCLSLRRDGEVIGLLQGEVMSEAVPSLQTRRVS